MAAVKYFKNLLQQFTLLFVIFISRCDANTVEIALTLPRNDKSILILLDSFSV